SKASFDASMLVSSSHTRPRHASEETTSLGLKWRRAKVLLPAPEAPTSTTSESAGRRNSSVDGSGTREDPHLRGRAERGVDLANRHEAHGVAVALRDAARPGLELGARPLEAVIGVAEAPRREAREARVVLGVGRRQDDRAGARELEQHALEGAESI